MTNFTLRLLAFFFPELIILTSLELQAYAITWFEFAFIKVFSLSYVIFPFNIEGCQRILDCFCQISVHKYVSKILWH
jgi:hypothetical protein